MSATAVVWRCSGCNRSAATGTDESVLESFLSHLVASERCEGATPLVTPAAKKPGRARRLADVVVVDDASAPELRPIGVTDAPVPQDDSFTPVYVDPLIAAEALDDTIPPLWP